MGDQDLITIWRCWDDRYIINSYVLLLDSGGQDSATVNLDFLKIPSTIETINYSTVLDPCHTG